mmetsp:Transcript_5083/g.7715  ORF Transcript_5083/g.7715 Transcript_5083/m.7715 type:complete len:87 (+) Transcript_5083:586-846(+)|eukprot:CAMPEP_0170499688 /NCGR_PEP_ID=MMETSP0208-20121228/32222_1 /TAXON_ID=197538 /ORGANISM="Strombidium inclinatum, Strain S3" /LENGTH=86 /DNA_ID=CAMNT_0010777349 /DNA_START=509 /DNA_END=769 /DNA_ORIENTATION=+
MDHHRKTERHNLHERVDRPIERIPEKSAPEASSPCKVIPDSASFPQQDELFGAAKDNGSTGSFVLINTPDVRTGKAGAENIDDEGS